MRERREGQRDGGEGCDDEEVGIARGRGGGCRGRGRLFLTSGGTEDRNPLVVRWW